MMTTETSLMQNYAADGYEAAKCDICLATFRTRAEKNIHFLNHFQRLSCSICGQNLIRIGDTWFSEHEHPDHIIPKTEANTDEGNELTESVILSDSIAIKSHDEAHEIFVQYESSPAQDDKIASIHDEIHESGSMDFNTFDNEIQPEHIILPEFIEQKPQEIIYNEIIYENASDECVNDTFEGRTVEDTTPKGIASKNNCPICNKFLVCKSSMKYHINICKGIKPYVCEACNKAFADKRNLVRHIKMCNSTMESNDSNTSTIPSISNTTNDINQSNQNDVKTNEESDKNDAQRREDEAIATGSVCKICNKTFLCRSNLKYHMNNHLGVKPHVCKQCGMAYADKRRLTMHEKTHLSFESIANTNDYTLIDGVKIVLTKENIAKLECPICSKKFEMRKALREHIRMHEGKRYQCQLCEKSFANVSYYRKHRKWAHSDVPSGEIVEPEELSIEDYDKNLDSSIPIDWMCEYCNVDFELEMRLARHIIKEHNEEQSEHPCNICAEKFDRPHDLLVHMRGHNERNQHKCTYEGCNQGFAFKSSLGVHIDKHTRLNKPIERRTQDDLCEETKKQLELDDGKNGFECNICNKKFPYRTNVLAHKLAVHTNKQKRIKCPIEGCDKICKTNAGIQGHIQIMHPDAMKTCETCNKTFCTKELLAKHQLQHQRPKQAWFACSLCDKKCPTKHQLRIHLGQHEKDVPCNICGEKFAGVRAMLLHRERHGKKPTITCRFKDCKKVFEDRREFMRHASTHPDIEKKRLICNYCGKGLSSMTSLRDHINGHTGERPHKCEHCDKCFGKTGCLNRHLLIHSGKKPYVCNIDGCQQAYRDSTDLKRHKFSIHNILTKKHICTICEKVFSEPKLLRKHTISVHNKINLATTLQSN